VPAIANRIHRGTLTFAFILQVAAALRVDHLDLSACDSSAERKPGEGRTRRGAVETREQCKPENRPMEHGRRR
jgi:hypothetical protein